MKNHREILQIAGAAILFVIGFLIKDPTLSFIIYLISYLIVGYEVIGNALKNIMHGKIFDENFLMVIATIGAFCIKEYPEAVAVMLFYQVGEYIGDKAVDNSKESITDLMDLRSDSANLLVDGTIKKVTPEKVLVNDHIVVKPGEKIPLDGIVIEGESSLDTASITGESIPRSVEPKSSVISGCINLTGALTIQVTNTYQESTASKILELMEHAAEKKTTTEKFITKFAKVYTPIVVVAALLLFLIPVSIFHGAMDVWLYRALVFLVISCPCALVISVPLGFFCGIGACSKKGILVKGSNDLEMLSKVKTVVFDKTGTLTKGVFNVVEVHPEKNTTKDELLRLAYLAEANSNHPIASSIKEAYHGKVELKQVKEHKEIPGKGIEITVGNDHIDVGNQKILDIHKMKAPKIDTVGTILYVAKNEEYLGYIVIADEIKEEAKSLNQLKQNGIEGLVVLSGDKKEIVASVSNQLQLTEYYAELLPEDKVQKVEAFKQDAPVAFLGDGVNDAPVLAMSDVGISMGGIGSDAAIEASDVVIMSDNPMALKTAIEISKRTNQIIWMNIIFAIGVKLIVLGLGSFGIASIWSAVFADVGVTILAILNALRIMRQ